MTLRMASSSSSAWTRRARAATARSRSGIRGLLLVDGLSVCGRSMSNRRIFPRRSGRGRAGRMVRIVGSYISPYVRKVLVVLDLKGLSYEIDPIIPFMGDDRFSRLSPLRRIPVFIDDKITLTDSTVICEYLDERYPKPALLPRDVADRA